MPRVSVQGLTKSFRRLSATHRRGFSSEGPVAIKHLFYQLLRPQEPVDHDRRKFLTALDDVTFDVDSGEVLGIIGRNGAGKSTLLKILARVLHPTAGRITIRGRVVSMLELGVGFAPEFSVRQNIQIHGRLASIPARHIRAAESDILALSGLGAYADLPLRDCPGGGAVQLGFASVVCLGAEIILADEVLAVGDSAFRQACEQRVRAAGTSGETVLFVSHDMAAIRRVCTRVIWIDHGRIVKDGPTNEVVNAYTEALLAGHLVALPSGDGLAASCTLLDVRLLDGCRAQVGALQMTEPGHLDCLVRVSHPGVSVRVDVELLQGKRLIGATTSEPFTTTQPTTYRAGVRIPADLLNNAQYQARFRVRVAATSAPSAEVVAAEETLAFSVMNPHPERSVWNDWQFGRGGLISPRLEWWMDVPASAVEVGHG